MGGGSTRFLRHSVSHYSEQWDRYPYPVAIDVAGLVDHRPVRLGPPGVVILPGI